MSFIAMNSLVTTGYCAWVYQDLLLSRSCLTVPLAGAKRSPYLRLTRSLRDGPSIRRVVASFR